MHCVGVHLARHLCCSPIALMFVPKAIRNATGNSDSWLHLPDCRKRKKRTLLNALCCGDPLTLSLMTACTMGISASRCWMAMPFEVRLATYGVTSHSEGFVTKIHCAEASKSNIHTFMPAWRGKPCTWSSTFVRGRCGYKIRRIHRKRCTRVEETCTATCTDTETKNVKRVAHTTTEGTQTDAQQTVSKTTKRK